MATDLFDLVKKKTLITEHLVGIDLYQTDVSGFTLLHRAAGQYGNIDATKLLLDTKWKRDNCWVHQWTPLQWAFANLNFDIAKLLLSTKREEGGPIISHYDIIKICEQMINLHTEKERNVQNIFPLTLLSI